MKDIQSKTQPEMQIRDEMVLTESTEKGRKIRFPVRYALPIMGFFGWFLMGANRQNLSLTIVVMVNATALYGNYEEAKGNNTFPQERTKDGEFIWSPKQQGIILGAFYWTVGIGNLVGGRMCGIFGSKKVYGFGMLIHSLLTLVTPITPMYHWHALVAVRTLAGFFQGIMYPALAPLVGKWIPAAERSLTISIIYGGMHFGSFIAVLISGYLCESEFLGGWPSVYYIFGIISCLWCVVFQFVVYETPSKHPWITDQELLHILENNKPPSTKKLLPIPWKSICFSFPVWGAVLSAFIVRWAQFHFYTVHPTYMATILKYPIAKNGVLSSLPHLLMFISVLASGYVSDVIRRRKCISISVNHKSFMTIGMFGYVLCLLGVIGVGYDVEWNTAFLIIAMGFTGIAYVGDSVTPVDMSPHFSGIIMGIRGFLATTPGFIVPIIVGIFTEEKQTMDQWRIVFYISLGVVIFGTIIFDIIGSAERQPWDPSYDKTTETMQCSQIPTPSKDLKF